MTFLYAWFGFGAVFGLVLDAYGHDGFEPSERAYCWLFHVACWPASLLICAWMLLFDKSVRAAAVIEEAAPEPEPPPAKPKPAPSPLMEPTWQPQTLH